MLILKIIVAVGILLAGVAKLLGAKPIAEQFEEFGLAPWMKRAVGVLEVAGAAGLFIEPLALWAAIGLALLIIGAVGNHLKVKHPISQSAPAGLLFILSLLLILLGK